MAAIGSNAPPIPATAPLCGPLKRDLEGELAAAFDRRGPDNLEDAL